MTIKDFENIVRTYFASNIKEMFVFIGDIADTVGLKDVVYPAVFIDVQSATLKNSGTQYSLQHFVITTIDKHSKSTFLDAVASCEKISYDYIAYLKGLNLQGLAIDTDNINMNVIKDTYNDDEVSGFNFTLNITLINKMNKCELPLATNPVVLLLESGAPILMET